MTTSTEAVGRGMRRLTLATVIVTYLLVVAGGVVRVTGSGLGCGETGHDWPICRGGLVPPPDLPTLIEFNHRMFATLSTILLVSTLIVAWRRYRHITRITAGASIAVVLLVIQILLGGITVELKLAGPVVMVHLANALLLLGVLVWLAVVAQTAGTEVEQAPASPHRRLLVAAAVAAYLAVLSGALVVSEGAGGYCGGWPLCGGGFELPSAALAVVNVAHRFVAGLVVLFLGYAMAKVRRSTGDHATRLAAMLVNVVIVVQVALGAAVVETHDNVAALQGLHIGIASLVWALTLLTAILGWRVAPAHPRKAAVTAAISGASA